MSSVSDFAGADVVEDGLEVTCTAVISAANAFILDAQVNAATISIFFDAVFYGFFLLSFLLAIFVVSERRRPRTKDSKYMIAATILLFVLATTTTILSFSRRSRELTLQINPMLCLPVDGLNPPGPLMKSFTVATGHLMMWIGDSIILWRSWALVKELKFIRMLTLFLQITAFLLLVIRIFIAAISPLAASILSVVFLLLLFATNILATFSLVRKHGFVKTPGLPGYNQSSIGILNLLIECGVLYAIVQMVIIWFTILKVLVPFFTPDEFQDTEEVFYAPVKWQSAVAVASSTITVCGELVSGILSCLSLALAAIKAGGDPQCGHCEILSAISNLASAKNGSGSGVSSSLERGQGSQVEFATKRTSSVSVDSSAGLMTV